MNVTDIRGIFQKQIETLEGENSYLFFCLQDGKTVSIRRHSAHDLDGLAEVLAGYTYNPTEGMNVPRFER